MEKRGKGQLFLIKTWRVGGGWGEKKKFIFYLSPLRSTTPLTE